MVVPGPISMRDSMRSHRSMLIEGASTGNTGSEGIRTLSLDVLAPCVVEHKIGVAVLPCILAAKMLFLAFEKAHLEECS